MKYVTMPMLARKLMNHCGASGKYFGKGRERELQHLFPPLWKDGVFGGIDDKALVRYMPGCFLYWSEIKPRLIKDVERLKLPSMMRSLHGCCFSFAISSARWSFTNLVFFHSTFSSVLEKQFGEIIHLVSNDWIVCRYP